MSYISNVPRTTRGVGFKDIALKYEGENEVVECPNNFVRLEFYISRPVEKRVILITYLPRSEGEVIHNNRCRLLSLPFADDVWRVPLHWQYMSIGDVGAIRL